MWLLQYFDSHPNNFLTRYKIQPGRNEPLEPGKFREACKVALKNQFLVSLPLNVLMYPLCQWRGCSMTLPLPSFQEFLWDVVGQQLS